MKKIINIIIVSILIMSLGGCFYDNDYSEDGLNFKEEYEELNGQSNKNGKNYLNLDIYEGNIIKYSNLKEVSKILDNGTGVIYLGYPSCPWCRNAVKVLLDAADSTSLDKIYYVNMYNLRDTMEIDETGNIITSKEASDDYYDIVNKLSSILPDYTLNDSNGNTINTGKKRIYVPLVLFVYEGKIVEYNTGTVDSQDDPYNELTNEQTTELYNKYLFGIHEVLNDVCEEDCNE